MSQTKISKSIDKLDGFGMCSAVKESPFITKMILTILVITLYIGCATRKILDAPKVKENEASAVYKYTPPTSKFIPPPKKVFDIVTGPDLEQENWEKVNSKIQDLLDLQNVANSIDEVEMPGDKLYSAQHILYMGKADCDNRANLIKEMLEELALKIKSYTGKMIEALELEKGLESYHDFKAKIISIKGSAHGVCMYQTHDGKWWSIDQGHVIDITNEQGKPNVYKGSKEFKGLIGSPIIERIRLDNAGEGASFNVSINAETWERDYELLTAKLFMPYKEDFDPGEYLDDWKEYGRVVIRLLDDTVVVYERNSKEKTKQIQMKSHTDFFDIETDQLIQREYEEIEGQESNFRRIWYEIDDNGEIIEVQWETWDGKVFLEKPDIFH